jgi:hypothetical protein
MRIYISFLSDFNSITFGSRDIIPSTFRLINSIRIYQSITTILAHDSRPFLLDHYCHSTHHYTLDHHRAALAVPILPGEAEAGDTLPAGSSLAAAAAVVAATVRLNSAEEVVAARATKRIDAAVLVLGRER